MALPTSEYTSEHLPENRNESRNHPLERWESAFAELPTGVDLRARPLSSAVSLRVDPAVSAALTEVLGVSLPGAGRWVRSDLGRLVWLGPDEWLLTGSSLAPKKLEDTLAAGVHPSGGAVVDVSANRIGIAVSGGHARELLSGDCAIDLHPRVFAADTDGGAAVQTTLANAGVVLLALAEDGREFELLVRSSFARHLADWLLDAALEFHPVSR